MSVIDVWSGLTVLAIPAKGDPYRFAYVPNGDMARAQFFADQVERECPGVRALIIKAGA